VTCRWCGGPLLVAVEADPLNAQQAAELERLRGQIALEQRRGSEADRLLLSAARRLQPVNADLARATYLDALVAAIWANEMASTGVREAAEAARTAPPGPVPPRAIDVLLNAVALRMTEGYATAARCLPRRSICFSRWTSAPPNLTAGSGSPPGGSVRSSPWSSPRL
jgi:hypothetical protein